MNHVRFHSIQLLFSAYSSVVFIFCETAEVSRYSPIVKVGASHEQPDTQVLYSRSLTAAALSQPLSSNTRHFFLPITHAATSSKVLTG